MHRNTSKEEWIRLLANQYFAYKEGQQPLDPFGIYKLSQLLQTCVQHDESIHMACIYLDTVEVEAWLVKGSTCHIHRDYLHEIPKSEKEPLRIGMDFNVLEIGRQAEPKAVSFGAGLPRGEYQWYFCDRCVDTIQLKHDLLQKNWTKSIVEKYVSIWVDWSIETLEYGGSSI